MDKVTCLADEAEYVALCLVFGTCLPVWTPPESVCGLSDSRAPDLSMS